MASTEQRIRNLIADNLEIDGQPIALPDDLNVSLRNAGLSSIDIVAFAKLVAKEFNVDVAPEDCDNVESVRELVDWLDAASG